MGTSTGRDNNYYRGRSRTEWMMNIKTGQDCENNRYEDRKQRGNMTANSFTWKMTKIDQ